MVLFQAGASFRPKRLYLVFAFLLSVFLIIKRKEKLLIFKPMPPEKLKQTIIDLGASFIKLAQVLATRSDFFPLRYLQQLKQLHDDIPPMRTSDFDSVFQDAFPISPFRSFTPDPIASASIGQVHEAYLQDGYKVAVKLRRRGIEHRVKADILILRFFNRLFRPLFSRYTKNSIESLIEEFSAMILQEISFKQELANLQEFSESYASADVSFPIPHPEFCSDQAIVMTYMEGIRLDDQKSLDKLPIPFKKIMEKIVDFYTEQMLIEGYFHADPHPGNLLAKEDGTLILLDFGMVKRISNATRISIIEIVKAANERDFESYIKACKRLGIVADEAPEGEMQLFAKRMFDIFNNEHLSALNMQDLAFNVLESMNDLPFKLPQEAIYIMRVSAIIEGLGTTHIENFNGVKDILPILKKNIPRALGIQNGIGSMLLDELASLPIHFKKSHVVLERLEGGTLEIRLSPVTIDQLERRFRSCFKGIIFYFTLSIIGVGLLLSSAPVWLSACVIIIGLTGIIYSS